MHTRPTNFDPTSTTNPVRSGTRGGGYGYLDIDEILETYRSGGSSGRFGPRARPQRDQTICTIGACRRVCLPACTIEESDALFYPGWGPVAPTSPRCWSSGNNLKQVSLPRPAPSSPPHSPSARGSLRARLSHTLLLAAQDAMAALLGARQHLEHALAQMELLCNTIRGLMGRIARVRPSLRVPCDRAVCACRRPGPLPAPFVRMWSRKRSCT